jgi:nicotinate-nucleotide adenylyltransferase
VTSASGRRIALLGGSFDPPHIAHVLLAAYVLAIGEVDEVLVVPVFDHAFGKRLAPFADRVRMCELAFADLPAVQVSRIEELLPHPNRTLDTLRRLRQDEPQASFRLVIGSDVLADAAKWHAFDEVKRLAPPLVVSRPGHAAVGPSLFPDVSSTQLRELFERHDTAALGKLMPHGALRHALERGLYGPPPGKE